MRPSVVNRRAFLPLLGAALSVPLLPAVARSPANLTTLKTLDGAPAPALSLTDLEGETFDLSAQKGKIIVINFWATWCPPCKAEMPAMQRAWNIISHENMDIWAVHIGGNEDKIMQFAVDAELYFPILLDLKSTAVTPWKVRGLPATVVVDGQGRMRLGAIGAREWDAPEILDQLRALQG